MLEIFGLTGLLQGLAVAYGLLAIGVLALVVWMADTTRGKAIAAATVVGIFGAWPVSEYLNYQARETAEAEAKATRDAFAREAWAYFRKKCDESSGEKIYVKVASARSVLVMKPLPPASEKDIQDQHWFGDPYSNATPISSRGDSAARKLISDSKAGDGRVHKGLEFVEMEEGKGDAVRLIRVARTNGSPEMEISEITKPVSRYGVSWEDISTPADRRYWVAGSRFRVVDIQTGAVVAERVGFLIEPGFGSTAGFRKPWLIARSSANTCPALTSFDYSDQQFISRLFRSQEEK